MRVGGRVFVSKKVVVCLVAAAFVAAALAGQSLRASGRETKRETKTKAAGKELKINLDKAIEVTLPALAKDLQPAAFRTNRPRLSTFPAPVGLRK